MAEQDMLADEADRVEAGAPERDLSPYSEWRDDMDLCILEAFHIYGSFLVGQTNGMSDALSLPAVKTALEIEGVPSDERPEMAQRLIQIHRGVAEMARHRAAREKRGR